MYDWRRMSPDERQRVVDMRRRDRMPWHRPPHCQYDTEHRYLLSAACYEHKPIVGQYPERMAECEEQLLEISRAHSTQVHAWSILPNHYHVLLETQRLPELLAEVGRFHGRSSRVWNKRDGSIGRKVWYSCIDRAMRSDRHFWVSMNYVHHNPVRHGYVERWQDWPFSSAAAFLEAVGRETAEEICREYPILDYGESWDPP
jgi:putative transposase